MRGWQGHFRYQAHAKQGTMKAFILERYGDASGTRLAEVRDPPAPGPHEVQVRTVAAGLNPVDYKIREGKLRMVMPLKLPAILGSEVAGVVTATGRGATRFQVGDHIYARVAKDGGGGLAEYINLPNDIGAHAPNAVDMETAAAVPLAGLTALQALRDLLKVGPGQRVLISAGAGGVGTFAIQIAKWLGAHVTTTASPRGEALVRALGADTVIDYTRARIADQPRDFDAGFDLMGGETLREMFRVVRPGGTVVTISDVPEPQTALQDLKRGYGLAALFWIASFKVRQEARRAGVHYRFMFMRPDAPGLALLAQLIDEGKLKVVMDRVCQFSEVADAMAYLESGRAKGKVVVRIAD